MIADDSAAGGLADVLPSALAVLGVPDSPDALGLRERLDGVRRIVVLLVDGLGYHLLPLAAPTAPTLAEVLAGRLGTLTELAAPFPSTTPVSLATLCTGVPSGAHGILGFTVNVPGTRRVLSHVTWSGDPDPGRWQPVPTQFARAARAGVPACVVARPEFAGSGLSEAVYRGARYLGAPDESLADRILDALAEHRLVYGYYPQLDTTAHVSGIASEEWAAAASDVDRLLARLVGGLPADAALLVSADHGMLDVPADHRFDLADDARLREGVAVMAGEPRVRYLHTAPGAVPDVLAAWRDALGPAARVYSREEAVAAGYFGPVPEEHLARIGDVVVICQDRYVVLDSRRERNTVCRLVAYHGSDSDVERGVPLVVYSGQSA
ncbi:alkaline phosphatase family protein [Rugosimonospora africana]|uniref:Alkaline phosphatase family protein n=1 Tax=Rugosimonospora africana TaxID=556532 RepID=A0A8J3QZR3_9ACTN|nr:nucleotide pyrophosphatase/phosphodiesterase family protein [Rugosimonospora africana]GIH19037.1 alkaline phosphatase family protein [Rugosimonospora africana]